MTVDNLFEGHILSLTTCFMMFYITYGAYVHLQPWSYEFSNQRSQQHIALNLFSRISSCEFFAEAAKIDRYCAGKRYRANVEVPIFYKPARQSSYQFRQLSLSILSRGKVESHQAILI